MKKAKIVWSKEAIEKTKIIYSHISKNFNVERAEKFYFELMDFCDHLAQFSKLGKLSSKFSNLREHHFDGNTIYYRIMSEEEILIVTVHARKTIKKAVGKNK